MRTFLFIIPSITNYYTVLEDIVFELVTRGEKVFIASSKKHISKVDCYERKVLGEFIEIDFPRGFEWDKHVKAAKQLRKIVSDIKPDIINVHFSAAMFTTAIAKTENWPFTVAMLHGLAFPMIKGWRKMAIGPAEKWASKKMDQLILLNEDDRFILEEFSDHENIHVLKSFGIGCDLEKYNLDNISQQTRLLYKRRLGLRKEDFVFIFVGRQVHFKGFDKLIRAYLKLYGEHKNIKLLLVGAKDNIHSTNLTSEEELKVRQCPGIINVGWKENVHEYLSVADVNVFPSEREGMPVNLMESIAMGVPVITSDSRGCNEVVEDQVNGILLKRNDIDEICKNMLHLYENKLELERLSDGALRTRIKFDRRIFLDELLDFFESVPLKVSN
ncbi:MAG: glycosyltransferase [Flavobacteriales bacterium]|nr:glycosyltransferase [Flavobacteriales bacterium]